MRGDGDMRIDEQMRVDGSARERGIQFDTALVGGKPLFDRTLVGSIKVYHFDRAWYV